MTKEELYWAERERANLLENLMDQRAVDAEIENAVQKAYQDSADQLYAWYGKYAKDNGITLAEAQKVAESADIKALAEKAKQYVADHDLSPEANAAMAEYNFSMKTSRLELLNNELRWRYFELSDQEEKITTDLLKKTAVEALNTQAGILGKTLYSPEETRRLSNYIAKTSYKGNTFSERIWGENQTSMKTELERILRQGIIQGKNPATQAKALSDLHSRKKSDAERLLRTEGARVRAHARAASFEKAGYTHFKWVPRGNPCKHCLDKVRQSEASPFVLKGADQRGEMPPLHPYCYCSTAPVEPDEAILSKESIDDDFEKQWQKALNGDKEARAHFERLYENTKTPDWKQFKLDDAMKPVVEKPAEKPVEQAITNEPRTRTQENTPTTMSKVLDINEQVQSLYFENGISEEQAEEIKNRLEEIIDNSSFAMRVPDESILEKILDDGRFKNQLETETSMGTFDPEARKQTTAEMFGLLEDELDEIQNDEFEKYGFFATKDPLSKPGLGNFVAEQYGDLTVRFKPDQVREFTTMTAGDSLGFINGRPVLVTDPNIAACDFYRMQHGEAETLIDEINEAIDKSDGGINPEDIADFSGTEFFEIQYHGDLKTGYIESISAPSDGYLSPEMIDRLKSQGIDVYVGFEKV